MRASSSAGLLVVIVFSALASAAHSTQWTVSYLHPPDAPESFGTGVSGVDEAGYITFSTSPQVIHHASRWTGSAASFVDMNPPGAIISQILGTDGINQSGVFRRTPTIPPDAFILRGAIWSGTAESVVDLHPGGGFGDHQSSIPAATEGGLQAGSFTGGESFPQHAARWNSSRASYDDIHPTGYVPSFTGLDYSRGLGTDGTSIVGSTQDGGFPEFPGVSPFNAPPHAGLWKFDPDVFIDLHPTGFARSEAFDVDGAIQVGHVSSSEFSGGPKRAALWSGTAASFVDMNPAGAGRSTLRGADGGYQVGSAAFSGNSDNAGIWSGTPDSFVNLHSLLTPSTYSSSEARGVWTDSNTLKVVGTAFNSNLGRNEAILWELRLRDPPPEVGVPTVPVGNPGNPADKRYTSGDPYHLRTGVGSVDHEFRIGTTEVSNAQYVNFLNAVATSADPYGLYNELMTSEPWGGIERSGSAPNFTYSVKPPEQGGAYTYDDKPVVYVSAGDAMRFANWLHNGQPAGAQEGGTTEDGAYTLNGATDDWGLAAATRNPDAQWFLPSEDEWYKAAYHQNDGASGNYWDYPNGEDSEPNNNVPSADTGNSANFNKDSSDAFSLTDVDAYLASRSPYGTQGQAGNVAEWNEALFADLDEQGQPHVYLGVRGGAWYSDISGLHAGLGWTYDPATFESSALGFRVASILQPLASHGDFNGDGSVDAADYIAWRKNDGTQDGYDAWRVNFGTQPGTGTASASAVPEPHAAAWLVILSTCSILVRMPRLRGLS